MEWTNLGVLIEARGYATLRVEVVATDIPSWAYNTRVVGLGSNLGIFQNSKNNVKYINLCIDKLNSA